MHVNLCTRHMILPMALGNCPRKHVICVLSAQGQGGGVSTLYTLGKDQLTCLLEMGQALLEIKPCWGKAGLVALKRWVSPAGGGDTEERGKSSPLRENERRTDRLLQGLARSLTGGRGS